MTVDFNPEMLVLARRSRGYTQTQLGKSAGVAGSSLSRYEAGTLPVPPENLSRLADALGYPEAFFGRHSTLVGATGGAIFHRKQQSLGAKTLYRAHACAEIRRLEITALLLSIDDSTAVLPEYPVDVFGDDPAKIARSVRASMNIPTGPIFNLTETLERNGCIVVAHDFGARQLDGFSQRPQYPPSFVHLNGDLPPDRWRWTLAHEIGHLVMHNDPMAAPGVVEQQADLFAAEFLTPAHQIRPMLDGLTFQKLGGLKREWKVSMQALIMRAYQLGVISAAQRRSMFMQLSRAGYRLREPPTLDPPVEKPSRMKQLARRHLAELDYGLTELCALLAITEAEFRKHYTDDIFASVDQILQGF